MELIYVILGIVSFSFVASQSGNDDLVNTLLPNVFRELDEDEDGFIQENELKNAFTYMDFNSDGIVTEKEFFIAAVTQVPSIWTCAKTLYNYLDVMAYNLIRVSEAKNVFAVFDTNNNGVIDENEFINYISVATRYCRNNGHINEKKRRRAFVPKHVQ